MPFETILTKINIKAGIEKAPAPTIPIVTPKATTTTTTASKTTTSTKSTSTVPTSDAKAKAEASVTPTPPAVDPLIQEALASTEHKSLIVEYRTPSGEIKSFITSNLANANIPGEFLSAREHLPSGGIGGIHTYTKGNQQVIFDVKEQVLATPLPQITVTIPEGRIPNVWQEQPVKAIPETQQSIINRENALYASMGWQGQIVASGRKSTGAILNAPDYLREVITNPKSPIGVATSYSIGTLNQPQESVAIKGNVIWKNLENKNYLEAGKNIATSSTMIDIVFPIITGGALKYINVLGKSVGVGTKAFRKLSGVGKAIDIFNKGAMATTAAMISSQAAATAIIRPSELGTFTGRTVLQFGMMGVGYKYFEPSIPKFEVIAKYGTQGKVQEVSIQKYIEIGKIKTNPMAKIEYVEKPYYAEIKDVKITSTKQFDLIREKVVGEYSHRIPRNISELKESLYEWRNPSEIEPQVANAIKILNAKGYETYSSGFSGGGDYTGGQVIEFKEPLSKSFTDIAKQLGFYTKEGYRSISIEQQGLSLSQVKAKFDLLAQELPSNEIFTGKLIRYGKQIIVKPKVSTGYEPDLDTYTGVRYIDTYRTFLRDEPIIKDMKGFKISEKGVPAQGQRGIPSKVLRASTGWEPSYEGYKGSDLIKSTMLSTKVWPKPMLAEDYVPWNAYLESGRAFYEGEPLVLLKASTNIRPLKQRTFTFKDIIKEQEPPKGSQMQGGRLKTITIQEQKTELKSKTLQLYKPSTEKQYLETMLQQKLEYEGYQKPILRTNLSFEEPTYVYTSLSEQQQLQQPKATQSKTSRQNLGIINISNQASSMDSISNQMQKNIQIQMQDIMQSQNEIQLLSQNQIQVSYQDVIQIKAQGTAQKQMQYQIQSQTQIQQQIQEQIQEQMQDMIKIQVPDYTYDTKQKYKFRKRLDEDDVIQSMKKFQNAYNVLIKEQYIFGGIKTKYPEFKRINVQPLTKESAYSLLATHLKQTARASGMIVEVETMNRPISKGFDFKWVDVSNEFYKKQGIIIQKTAHRIGTPGEKAEITYKGQAARRRR